MSLGLDMRGNYLPLLPPNSPRELQVSAINDIIARLNDMLKTQVFSDGNNKRMLFGYQKDGWGTGKDFGIKISMEGVDVTSATHAQLIFSMDMETWQWLDPDEARNFVNIGMRQRGTRGFEMSAPGETLNDPNA